MLPNMKFYVISIVAIFVALGIGIFIGFSMDTKGFITEQQEGLIEILESQFETIARENQELGEINEELVSNYKIKNEYIEKSYGHIVPNRLEGFNVAIIETNPDYVTSGIGRDIELAGGNVLNVTTINDKLIQDEKARDMINNITKMILTGEDEAVIQEYDDSGYIDALGDFTGEIDHLIICGGASREESIYVSDIDKMIIGVAKNYDKGITGVEKETVKNSYIEKYKEYKIDTVDNVDTIMGRIAMVLSLNNGSGNYGIKGTANGVIPSK